MSSDKNSQTNAASASSRSICLLTPYTGTNYGDSAIQQGTIDGIRRRIPAADITGITLAPDDTRERHGLNAVPITGLAVTHYSEFLFSEPRLSLADYTGNADGLESGSPEAAGGQTNAPGFIPRLWKILKAIPLIGPLAKLLLRFLRQVANIWSELRSLVRSYRFLGGQDLLLVSGGGQLDDEWGGPFGHPYAMFRWAALARLRGVDVAFLSVGVGKIRSWLSRWFIKSALRLASYRSYRDTGSRSLLDSMKFTRNDPVVPDLAFSLERPAAEEVRGQPARVAISMISYGRPECWPIVDEDAYANYLSCMVETARKLLEQGLELTVVRSSGADQRAIDDLRVQLDGDPGAASRVKYPTVDRLDDLMDVLESCDIVVASRLHSIMLAHLAGRPCVAISFDRKVDQHMLDFDQAGYCTSIHGVGSTDVLDRYQELERHLVSSARTIRHHASNYRHLLDAQYDAVLGEITHSRSEKVAMQDDA